MPTQEPRWELEAFDSVSFEGTVQDLLGSFDAYVRVFNPARDPAAPGDAGARTWAQAGTTGARVTGDTQWGGIHPDPALDEPAMGDLDPEVAARLASILGRHTTTPEECAFLLWTGYAETDALAGVPTIRRGHRTDLAILTGPVAAGRSPEHGRRPMNWRPRDRAWALGNDIYARSVYIGADSATVRAIHESPHLETALASGSAILTPEDRRG